MSEIKLFRAVVYQALLDATKHEQDPEKQEAISWFVSSADFEDVCDLADLDPFSTKRRALVVISEPTSVNDFIRKRLNVLLKQQTSTQYS